MTRTMTRFTAVLLMAALSNAVAGRSIAIDRNTILRSPTESGLQLPDLNTKNTAPGSNQPGHGLAVGPDERVRTSPTSQSRSTRVLRRNAQRKKYTVSQGSDKAGHGQRNQDGPPPGLPGKYSRLGAEDPAADKAQPPAAKKGPGLGEWKDPVGLMKETLGALKEGLGLLREMRKMPDGALEPVEEPYRNSSATAASPRVEPEHSDDYAGAKRQVNGHSGLETTLKKSLKYLHSVLKSTTSMVGDPVAALGTLVS